MNIAKDVRKYILPIVIASSITQVVQAQDMQEKNNQDYIKDTNSITVNVVDQHHNKHAWANKNKHHSIHREVVSSIVSSFEGEIHSELGIGWSIPVGRTRLGLEVAINPKEAKEMLALTLSEQLRHKDHHSFHLIQLLEKNEWDFKVWWGIRFDHALFDNLEAELGVAIVWSSENLSIGSVEKKRVKPEPLVVVWLKYHF